MKYDVYFEIFGKKMKTTIEAKSKDHAELLIKNKIQFHKVLPQEAPKSDKNISIDDAMNMFNDMISGKK